VKIEDELKRQCQDILTLLDNHLIPASKSEEAKVFYMKMKGDYFRYISEFANGNERNTASDKALESYRMA
jgi:14-3-3 protein epsilon